MKLAAAQIECCPGDIRANLARHLEAIVRARAEGVDLLAFPELSLTDYLETPDCTALALTSDAAPIMELAAASGQMSISFGFIERTPDRRFYNVHALISRGGLAALHRKLYLPGYGALKEDRVYDAGEALAIADLPDGWRVATLVCADLWNPAFAWLAALRGANLLIVPAASSRGAVDGGFDSPGGWRTVLEHTALIYGLPVLFSNHCGMRGAFDFWGGSRILDANARAIAKAGEAPELILGEIDFSTGLAARTRLPTIADANPELVHNLLLLKEPP